MTICKYCGKKYHLQEKDAETWRECYCSRQCYDAALVEDDILIPSSTRDSFNDGLL